MSPESSPLSRTTDLRLETRYCALCGPGAQKKVRFQANFSENDLNAEVFSARRMPDRRHFRLMECETCGIVFSDPACDTASLARLYKEAAVNYDQQEDQIYESYAPVLDRALPWLQKRGTFVEIGGGRGFMLKYAVRAGFEHQIEIEPSADAEKRFCPPAPGARFVRSLFVAGTLPPASATLICFFQMLDHVPNPGEFVRNIYEALEPGGVAVCVTHNTLALSAALLGERSPIYDIEHTYLFNPANMKRLFGQAGFNKSQTFPVANHYAIRHWAHLAPIGREAKKWLLPLLDKTGVADWRLKIRAGNFGIVAVK